VETRPALPKPRGYVNDYANVLSNKAETQLNEISAALERATGAQLVFVVMPSIAPYDDFTYGMAIFDTWKIGQKGKDNGLLILLALKERRIRIITGYGLESILPDGKLGRYRDQYLIPYLRQKQIGAGLVNIGVVIAQDIAKAAGVKLTGAAARAPRRGRHQGSGTRVLVLLMLLVVLGIISHFNRRRWRSGYMVGTTYIPGGYYRSGGGGFGGGFSGFGGGFSGGGGVGGSW